MYALFRRNFSALGRRCSIYPNLLKRKEQNPRLPRSDTLQSLVDAIEIALLEQPRSLRPRQDGARRRLLIQRRHAAGHRALRH